MQLPAAKLHRIEDKPCREVYGIDSRQDRSTSTPRFIRWWSSPSQAYHIRRARAALADSEHVLGPGDRFTLACRDNLGRSYRVGEGQT